MPFDQGLAQRVRETLDHPGVTEKKMFGGLCFLLRGNMCVGVTGENLMVRVGPDAYAESLAQPHAREMDFTGKPLKGFVFVAPEGFDDDGELRAWIERGTAFALSLPAK